MWNSPLQYVRSMGASEPSCRPAAATTTLKTDPGAYWLASARFMSGVMGSRTSCEPLVAAEGAGEPVERKGRARGHRQHVAVARIHHDDRPGMSGHRALGHLLNAPVDRGDDLGARVGLLAPHDFHLPAERIHLDALAAVSAAQVLVEQALEPRLPDHVAPPVPPLLHLLVVHFADVTEEMGGEGTRRIHALGLDFDDHPRQLEPALPELGDLLE